MGIPHLTSLLQKYAVQAKLGGHSVVIDGPGLAHHIYCLCRRGRIGQPSYDLLSKSVLQWLDKLVEANASIDAIYFDGFLPPRKRTVRLERLYRQNSRLQQFHRTTRNGCEAKKLLATNNIPAPDLFPTASGYQVESVPIFPSFLVPCIIETLRSSDRYCGVSHVVPEEADVFCADYLCRRGDIVITADSDLLAHDLGTGSVAFFKDMRVQSGTITCEQFCPRTICEKLGLNYPQGLWRLAFEVWNNGNVSLSTAVKSCSVNRVKDTAAFEDFAAQYRRRDSSGLLGKYSLNRLESLDPRVSEVFLQFEEVVDVESNQGATEALIAFLPGLLDCPIRGSAWARSVTIRQLAYTFLHNIRGNKKATHILEHSRVQSVSCAGKQVELLSIQDSQTIVSHIQSAFEQAAKAAPGNDGFLWTYIALFMDVYESVKAGANSLCLHMVRTFSKTLPTPQGRLSWDMIHFIALLQACFYSVRILKQTASSVLVDSHPKAAVHSYAVQLQPFLMKLPSLIRTPSMESVLEVFHDDQTSVVMLDMLRQTGIAVDLDLMPPLSPNNELRGGGEGGEEKSKAAPGLLSGTSSNIFEILMLEG